MLRVTVVFAHTNFDENIVIANWPPKRNSKERPLAPEFNFRLSGLSGESFGYIRMCHRAQFQLNRTIGN